MSWRVARSLDVLLSEINAAAPNRSKISDGSIGDAAHASRSSDHNPWRQSGGMGVVGARDFTHDPADGCDAGKIAAAVAAKLGQHPALGSGAYVIWNYRIISADRRGEGWRAYTGSNGHTQHVHVSVATSASGFDSTQPWGVMAPPAPTEEDEIMAAADDIKDAIKASEDRIIQRIGGSESRERGRDVAQQKVLREKLDALLAEPDASDDTEAKLRARIVRFRSVTTELRAALAASDA